MSYEITLELALKIWEGTRLSARSAQRIMKGRGVQWRRLREKPLLTKDDVRGRFRFAKKYVKRSARFWERCVAIDGTLTIVSR